MHDNRVVRVTFTCGCIFELELEHIEAPTDEEIVEGATNPSLAVGSPARCDEHGAGQLVMKVEER